MYEWLEAEIAKIKTRRFHVVDGPASGDVLAVLDSAGSSIPPSYRVFVCQFGGARLYRSAEAYLVGVRSDWQEGRSLGGDRLRVIGHYEDARAYFKETLLASGRESPVFEWGAGGLRQVSGSFASWLEARSAAARRTFGKKRWSAVVEGPPPFSPAEEEIVAARRQFEWRVVGGTVAGPIRFEVVNGSSMTLPYLSIGVRHRGGAWVGGVWLPVGNILPGKAAIVVHECYPMTPRAELEPFALPDPEPEDRERYWEFRSVAR